MIRAFAPVVCSWGEAVGLGVADFKRADQAGGAEVSVGIRRQGGPDEVKNVLDRIFASA
jgi:hypothetical protein